MEPLVARSLDISRKEQGRLPRNDKIEEALDTAINVLALQFNAQAGYDRHIKSGLTVCGKSVIALMAEDDEPTLVIPTWVSRQRSATKDGHGLVVTLADRAIVAWTEGRVKLRYFAQTIPYDTVNHARAEESDLSVIARRVIVEVDGDKWTFNIPQMFQDESFVDWLVAEFAGGEVVDET